VVWHDRNRSAASVQFGEALKPPQQGAGFVIYVEAAVSAHKVLGVQSNKHAIVANEYKILFEGLGS